MSDPKLEAYLKTREAMQKLDKLKREAIAEWCKQTVEKHTDPTLGTTDFDGIAEDVLKAGRTAQEE